MTIFPGVAEASVGSVVPVHVSIVGGRDVASVPFHLMFDPQVLRFQSAAEGKFLGADGNSTAFLVGPDSSGSRVVVGQARLGQVPGVSGGGDLCVIFFDVVGPGEPSLAIERAGVIQSSGRRQPSFFDVRPLTVK